MFNLQWNKSSIRSKLTHSSSKIKVFIIFIFWITDAHSFLSSAGTQPCWMWLNLVRGISTRRIVQLNQQHNSSEPLERTNGVSKRVIIRRALNSDIPAISYLSTKVFYGKDINFIQKATLLAIEYTDMRPRLDRGYLLRGPVFQRILCDSNIFPPNKSSLQLPCCIYVATLNEKIVGSAEIALRPSSQLQPIITIKPTITNLCVDNSVRRCGIGSKLLLMCENTASEWAKSYREEIHRLDRATDWLLKTRVLQDENEKYTNRPQDLEPCEQLLKSEWLRLALLSSSKQRTSLVALDKVVLNVDVLNSEAITFYNKNGYFSAQPMIFDHETTGNFESKSPPNEPGMSVGVKLDTIGPWLSLREYNRIELQKIL